MRVGGRANRIEQVRKVQLVLPRAMVVKNGCRERSLGAATSGAEGRPGARLAVTPKYDS